jgi:lysozyme
VTYNRAKLESELVRDEGERLAVYRCTAGKLTIGVGRNLDDVGIRPIEVKTHGLSVKGCIDRGITREQSRAMLANDIEGCAEDLDRRLPWWRNLSDARQRVLLNMCFNLGIKGLLGFKNTLAMVERGDFAGASRGMAASKWHDQVGKRAQRLEAMMLSGKEPA